MEQPASEASHLETLCGPLSHLSHVLSMPLVSLSQLKKPKTS